MSLTCRVMIPAKPKTILQIEMEFNNKHYKFKKTKVYLKQESIFFICTSNNLNSKNNLKFKQTLKKKNLTCLTIRNELAKKFLKKSIFKNFSILINGPVCFIKPEHPLKVEETLKTLTNINDSITMIGLKINNKIYSMNQIKTLNLLNYSKNVINFTKTLNTLTKIPYYKLKK